MTAYDEVSDLTGISFPCDEKIHSAFDMRYKCLDMGPKNSPVQHLSNNV